MTTPVESLGPVRQARILIVDDEAQNVDLLEQMLRRANFVNTESTTDPRRAMDLFEQFEPDLVLLDLRMPDVDGFEILEQIRTKVGGGVYMPVLVLTAEVSPEAKRRALTLGARDFLAKPFDVTEVLLRIKNLLEARFLHTAMARHNEVLEVKVAERTVHLWQAVQDLSRAQEETRDATHEMIKRLASAAELRDAETGRHIERMSRYSGLLAKRLDLGSERCETILLASSMHDIGKIGVPDSILRKEGALTKDEMLRMTEHAEIGHRILVGSDAAVVDMAALIALTHHERWDGSGYPRGLVGDAIPLEGRIASVADVFDALTSDRVYRPAFPLETALSMMREQSGKLFDPEVLEIFMASIDEVLDVYERYSDEHLAL